MIPLLQGCKTCIMVILIMMSFLTMCWGHHLYLDYIPNGYLVPNPCTNSTTDLWPRVGHKVLNKAKDTDKEKNMFGEHFMAILAIVRGNIGEIWPKLCCWDSDGDTRTNGVELGDPDCKWTVDNQLKLNTVNITHPGIPDDTDGAWPNMCPHQPL